VRGPPRTAPDESHDPVTHFPSGDSWSHRLHFAGVLETRDIRGPARRRRVLPAPLDQIGSVEPRGVDANPDVIGPNLGLGYLADGDDLGTTGAFIDHCAHVGYWLLAIGYWLFDRRTIPRSIKTGHRGTRMSQITADSQ
jgi:hypothetical protein